MADRDEDDDEALRWAGDEERGIAAPRRGVTSPEPQDADDAEPDVEPPVPGGRGRTAAAAVFVPLYLVIAVGWVLGIQWTSSGTTNLATEVLWQFGEFLAIVAAPLWFVATIRLTADSRPLARVGWLALGVGVLFPWPLVLGVIGELS